MNPINAWQQLYHTLPPAQIERIQHPLLQQQGITLDILREDLIHPEIPGNKYWKLKYPLQQAITTGHTTLLTFGGAYSNHIHAVAMAGKWLNLNTIGVIRGELHRPLNPILQQATAAGMQLHALSRQTYRHKHTAALQDALTQLFGDHYLIPEGGAHPLAICGTEEMLRRVTHPYHLVCTATGTGGTLAGIIRALTPPQQAIGFSTLKGGDFLYREVAQWLPANTASWSIELDYHGGGYAKCPPSLTEFIQQFQIDHGIFIEPVYTGKMLFGLFDLIRQRRFLPGCSLLAIHTGGIHS